MTRDQLADLLLDELLPTIFHGFHCEGDAAEKFKLQTRLYRSCRQKIRDWMDRQQEALKQLPPPVKPSPPPAAPLAANGKPLARNQ